MSHFICSSRSEETPAITSISEELTNVCDERVNVEGKVVRRDSLNEKEAVTLDDVNRDALGLNKQKTLSERYPHPTGHERLECDCKKPQLRRPLSL